MKTWVMYAVGALAALIPTAALAQSVDGGDPLTMGGTVVGGIATMRMIERLVDALIARKRGDNGSHADLAELAAILRRLDANAERSHEATTKILDRVEREVIPRLRPISTSAPKGDMA